MKKEKLNFTRLIPVIILFLFLGNIVSAQENKVITEPVKEQVQVKQNGEINSINLQNAQETVISGKTGEGVVTNKADAAKKDGNGKSATSVKKVKSSRPDLTKSNGARPPTIVRPSGSGIPKGAGKPGGAVGPGRR
jgi:hypothetical protein